MSAGDNPILTYTNSLFLVRLFCNPQKRPDFLRSIVFDDLQDKTRVRVFQVGVVQNGQAVSLHGIVTQNVAPVLSRMAESFGELHDNEETFSRLFNDRTAGTAMLQLLHQRVERLERLQTKPPCIAELAPARGDTRPWYYLQGDVVLCVVLSMSSTRKSKLVISEAPKTAMLPPAEAVVTLVSLAQQNMLAAQKLNVQPLQILQRRAQLHDTGTETTAHVLTREMFMPEYNTAYYTMRLSRKLHLGH